MTEWNKVAMGAGLGAGVAVVKTAVDVYVFYGITGSSMQLLIKDIITFGLFGAGLSYINQM